MRSKRIPFALGIMVTVSLHVFAFTTEKLFEETVYNCKSMRFVNNDTGWAVGDVHWNQTQKKYMATILKTVDRGSHWVEQNAEYDQSLLGVTFVDVLHGWACGENGTVLATQDGGETWTKKKIATSQELKGISFADARHGWLVEDSVTRTGFTGDAEGWKGSMWYTSDGGEQWTKQDMPANVHILHTVKAVDSLTAWAVGCVLIGTDRVGRDSTNAALYRTTDGGKNWETTFKTDSFVAFTNIDFVTVQKGCAVGFGGVVVTNDGGQTWLQGAGAGGLLRDVQFSDTLHAYAVGYDYVSAQGPPVYRTKDGGLNWTKGLMRHFQDIDGNNLGLFSVSNTSQGVIAVGDKGFQCSSNSPWSEYDFGEDTSFQQRYICRSYRFASIVFTNSKNGWAAGKYGYMPDFWGQAIFQTSDGGLTWNTQYQQVPDTSSLFSHFRMNRVWFIDSMQGWAVGSDDRIEGNWQGSILHTADGGAHWTTQGSNLHASWSLEFYGLHFPGKANGWALTGKNFPSLSIQLAHTLDGGTSWKWVDTKIESTGGIGIGFLDINGDAFFFDSLHGWACGGLGVIVHTSDGGETWVKQNSPSPSGHLASVAFTDTARGWLGGEGELYFTTNGGAHWQKKDLGSLPTAYLGDITRITFADSIHGWLSGENGIIARTLDGGKTWFSQGDEQYYPGLRSLSFINDTVGWACAGNAILRIIAGSDEVALPSVVMLLAPAMGSTVTTDTVVFSWNKSLPGVDKYSLVINTDSLLLVNNIHSHEFSTTDTTLKLPIAQVTASRGCWRVRAHNASGWGSYSPIWKFDVQVSNVSNTDHGYAVNVHHITASRAGLYYQLPRTVDVWIRLFNASGRMVFSYACNQQAPGRYFLPISAKQRAKAFYFLDFRAGSYRFSKKVFNF